LLLSLRLVKPFKAEAKKLAKQLISAANQTLSSLMPEVVLLLDRALNQAATDKSSGFGFNLFGKDKSPKDAPNSHH
jgi:hypothetical protein